MLPVGVFVATLLFIAFLVHRRRRSCSSSNNAVKLPPGSRCLPFIGETIQMLMPSSSLDLPYFYKSRILKYGPMFQTRLIGRSLVVSADENLNGMIAHQEGTLAEIWYLDTFSKVFSMEGEKRLSAAGDIHKYLRGTTLKHFGVESIKNELLDKLQDLVDEMMQNWSSQESVDVKQSVLTMIIDFSANLIFGYDKETTDKELGEKLSFISHSLLSIPINIRGTSYHKCLEKKEVITNIIRDTLKERLSSPESRRGDFMDHVIEDSNAHEFITDEFIIKFTFLILFASSETLSISITLLLKFLSENPSTLDELVDEHERFLKNRANLGSQLTWDEVKSMTFTLGVVNESLRLGNIVLGIFRKALKDTEFNGYTIPAGWIIMMVTSASQFNPTIYTDPFTFNPSRWKDLEPDVVSKGFMPFGTGMRQCAGAEFAKAFMVTLLHVLVTKHRWTKIKGGEISRTTVFKFKNALHIKVENKE